MPTQQRSCLVPRHWEAPSGSTKRLSFSGSARQTNILWCCSPTKKEAVLLAWAAVPTIRGQRTCTRIHCTAQKHAGALQAVLAAMNAEERTSSAATICTGLSDKARQPITTCQQSDTDLCGIAQRETNPCKGRERQAQAKEDTCNGQFPSPMSFPIQILH